MVQQQGNTHSSRGVVNARAAQLVESCAKKEAGLSSWCLLLVAPLYSSSLSHLLPKIMSLQEVINLVRAGKVDELAAFLDQNEINLNQVKKSSSGGGSVTPLSLAAMHGHLEVAELLLLRGAEVNFKSEGAVCSALRKAVEKKKMKMVKLLIKHGAEAVYLSRWKCPLTCACEQGDLELVRALLPDGASHLNHFTFDRDSSHNNPGSNLLFSF